VATEGVIERKLWYDTLLEQKQVLRKSLSAKDSSLAVVEGKR